MDKLTVMYTFHSSSQSLQHARSLCTSDPYTSVMLWYIHYEWIVHWLQRNNENMENITCCFPVLFNYHLSSSHSQ